MTIISYGYDRTRPRTKITLDASNLGSANNLSEKPLVLMGSALGGAPHVPFEVTNYAQAREIFRGGELLDAIEMAWNPSPTVKAGRIFAIRTDEATQAKHTSGGLTVKSKLYGVDANSIQIEYTNNAITGAKRFSVYFTKERYEKTYDNIGNIFKVKYTGEEAQASITIEQDAETKEATRLILKTGADAGSMQAVRTYELGQGVYEDVHILVNDINNLPDFEASMNSMGGFKNVKTKWLDPIAAGVDIKTTDVTVKAVAGDLVNVLKNDPFVAIEVDLATGTLPETLSLTNLTGGSTSPAPASWSTMFEKIADLGAYYIVPLTANIAIQGELSQYLRDESINGNHLRALVGGEWDESIEEMRARQMSIRNARVSVVGNSGTRRMADGRVYNFPAYMYAALVGGIASGLEVGEPITYKHVNIESLDRKFSSDQLDQLNASGIVMTEFVRTRRSTYFRLVSDPTSYNIQSEPVQNRMSLGEVSDYLTTDLRTELDENFIGTRIASSSASILKNAVESFLDKQKNVGGLIVDYNPDDVQVVISGNTARINIVVQPAQGLDYINVHITYEDNELVA